LDIGKLLRPGISEICSLDLESSLLSFSWKLFEAVGNQKDLCMLAYCKKR
jgi:hypothetical protein